jgi:hypothetical protein
MKDYKLYQLQDLINDRDFIKWFRSPDDQELKRYWDLIFKDNPKLNELKVQAEAIIRNVHPVPIVTREIEKEQLWKRIELSTGKNRFSLLYKFIAVAAAVAILIAGSFFVNHYLSNKAAIDYSEILANTKAGSDIQLILGDKQEIAINKKEAEILYHEGGGLTVNSEKKINQSKESRSAAHTQFNQVIVPFGKRTSIVFGDGTKMWLNSGSRAIYPAEFSGNRREIYLEGEAYFDVTTNVEKPFIVKSGNMEITVLGTSFNVNSYSDDKKASVVLIKGKVNVKSGNNKPLELMPNEMVSFDKTTSKIESREVDIYDYISWKEGWLRSTSEQLGSIVNKLIRYYDCKIEFEEIELSKLKMSGKLDLKDSIQDVLLNISKTAPISFEEVDGKIIIKNRNN